MEEDLKKIIAVVVATHFHEDCLGGIGTFHAAGIKTYAFDISINLARNANRESPKFGFTDSLKLSVGNNHILLYHFGSGHTLDNISAYIPAENLLFGGCRIKAIGAGKVNLLDAEVLQWPRHFKKTKS